VRVNPIRVIVMRMVFVAVAMIMVMIVALGVLFFVMRVIVFVVVMMSMPAGQEKGRALNLQQRQRDRARRNVHPTLEPRGQLWPHPNDHVRAGERADLAGLQGEVMRVSCVLKQQDRRAEIAHHG
jgi:hypothetical protein